MKTNKNYCDRPITLKDKAGNEYHLEAKEIFETSSIRADWNRSLLVGAYYNGIEIDIDSLPRNYITKY